MTGVKLFSGNANVALSEAVAQAMGVTLGQAKVGRFSDGEISVEILEHVRGQEAFILQPTCAPVNDNLMELIIMADALRRASVHSITAVVPYFGYARQDRRIRSARVPITAKVVADMMASVGIERLITVDVHAEQIQGFFSLPVDNIFSSPVFLEDIDRRLPNANHLVVSPDVGGVVRARAIAKRLHDGADLAIVDKRRDRSHQVQVMHVIGDVEGRDCIVVDDMVDTAGTLCKAADALKAAGARSIYAYCTHPVLSGNALASIDASALDCLVVSDSIPLSVQAQRSPKICQLSIAGILAETIRRVCERRSVSSLFREALDDDH